jgi:hypothetical protein
MDSFTDNRGTLYFPIKNNNFQAKECTISINNKNVFRGIHVNDFDKLITCIQGSFLDYVINLETGEINEYPLFQGDQILVKANFGHAFISKTDNSILMYHFSDIFGNTQQIHWSQYLSLPENIIISDNDSKKK